MAAQSLVREDVRATLAALAPAADAAPRWPLDSWQALCRSGAVGWAVPTPYGGTGLDGVALLEGYELLAGACLTTCFILSQRDAAVRRLRDSAHERLCADLLPGLARGETFATVGLSQLTTSRQHLRPTFTGRLDGAALVLDGVIPWVTGAERADYVVVGAVLDDGRQVLAVLPRGTPGVTVGPPLDLVALEGSVTAEVRCDGVRLGREWLLAGPAEAVMKVGRGGTGGLETSCLALGLAGAAVEYLLAEAQRRHELMTTAGRLEQTRRALRSRMHELATAGGPPEAPLALRAEANTFVLRATQAALTASKGTGFLRSHPAQRWARQALFFLVWSCPRPAAEATLAQLAPEPAFHCP